MVRYMNTKEFELARSKVSTVLQPSERIIYDLPEGLDSCERVAVTPRHQVSHWLQPRVVDVKDGQVALVNSSKSEISVRKSDHLAEIRSTELVNVRALEFALWSVRRRIHSSIKISTKFVRTRRNTWEIFRWILTIS